MKPKLFMTYSHTDARFAAHLFKDLGANGLDCFAYEESIKAGDPLWQTIEKDLRECDIYVPVLSNAELESEWCKSEMEVAVNLSHQKGREGRPHIIPVLMEDCRDRMWALFQSRRYIDFAHRYKAGLKELLETIGVSRLPSEAASFLDAWWQQRSYAGEPFGEVLADAVDLKLLEAWDISFSQDVGESREDTHPLTTLQTRGDAPVSVVFGPLGGGKTFYRRLAAQVYRDSITCRGVLELDLSDLLKSEVWSEESLEPDRLALCVYEKILENHPGPLPRPGPRLGRDQVNRILHECDLIARSFAPELALGKLFVFLDDLDKGFANLSTPARSLAVESLLIFLHAVMNRDQAECLALRLFLPVEQYELVSRQCSGELWDRLLPQRLSWTEARCIEVAERRLETAWAAEPRAAHLARLLSGEAFRAFCVDLTRLRERGALSPRHTIGILSTVTHYAARHGVLNEPIGEGLYRAARRDYNRSCGGWPPSPGSC